MTIENVNPTWHETLLYKDFLDEHPSADEQAARVKIEQRVLRAQQAQQAREEGEERERREAREEDQEDRDALSRWEGEGGR